METTDLIIFSLKKQVIYFKNKLEVAESFIEDFDAYTLELLKTKMKED